MTEQEVRDKNKFIIQNQPQDCLFVIQMGYVGNALLLWAKDGNGYTTDLDKAHLFTRNELMKHHLSPRVQEVIWKYEDVKKATQTIVESQILNRECKSVYDGYR